MECTWKHFKWCPVWTLTTKGKPRNGWFSLTWSFNQNDISTSMRSSRMRTARLLTVCLLGVCAAHFSGRLMYTSVHTSPVYTSPLSWFMLRYAPPCPSPCWDTHTPLSVNRMIDAVKTLPCPMFHMRTVITTNHSAISPQLTCLILLWRFTHIYHAPMKLRYASYCILVR